MRQSFSVALLRSLDLPRQWCQTTAVFLVRLLELQVDNFQYLELCYCMDCAAWPSENSLPGKYTIINS